MTHHILYPGAFKPVHPGHIVTIMHYSSLSDTMVHIIISRADRDNFTYKPTLNFLTYVFKGAANVTIHLADARSPIMEAYGFAHEKKFGDGYYALLSSSKGNDRKRADDFYKYFSRGGTHETDGVIPEVVIANPIMSDDNTEYSSTAIRDMIKQDGRTDFLDSYKILVKKGICTAHDISAYFGELRNDYFQTIHSIVESTSVTHINHPYDYIDMTFGELKDMMHAVSVGSVQDITEKIDGINLMASVNADGVPIFARNKTQLYKAAFNITDMMNYERWNDIGIAPIMKNAAKSVEMLFKKANIQDSLFNETKDGRIIRNWLNMEIVSSDNQRVSLYNDNFIAMHGFKTVQYDRRGNVLSLEDSDKAPDKLLKIAQSIQGLPMKFIATPNVTVGISMDTERKYIARIDSLMSKYGLMNDSTIGDLMWSYIEKECVNHREFAVFDNGILDSLIERWVFGKKGMTLKTLLKGRTNSAGHEVMGRSLTWISNFEKNEIPQIKKKSIGELKRIIEDFGNDIINSMKGGIDTHGRMFRKEIGDKINKSARNADTGYSLTYKDRSDKNRWVEDKVSNMSGSEGLVFTYGGRKMKLTGYYTPINMML